MASVLYRKLLELGIDSQWVAKAGLEAQAERMAQAEGLTFLRTEQNLKQNMIFIEQAATTAAVKWSTKYEQEVDFERKHS